jgi:hypothetical protein
VTDAAETLLQRIGSTTPGSVQDLPVSVSSADLERLWSELMPDSYAARRGLDAFLAGVEANAERSSDAELHFRPGGWQVDLRRGAVQGVIAAALIAGLLATLGATQIPAAVATAVVPLFFDVRKVVLTPGQEYLLADLVAHREALAGTLTAQDLYARLDEDVRSSLSFMDFADFLDTCRRAGLADPGTDGTVTLRPADHARFRVTFV